jgi:hypothetical protein
MIVPFFSELAKLEAQQRCERQDWNHRQRDKRKTNMISGKNDVCT